MNYYSLQASSNYVGTKYALGGCLFDNHRINDTVCRHFGFPPMNVIKLLGEDFKPEMVKKYAPVFPRIVKPGDVFFIQLSGHGTPLTDIDGDEVDGKDEAVVTNDLQFITDDEIHKYLIKFVSGSLVVGWFDCCHSGTIDRSFGSPEFRTITNLNAHVVIFSGCLESGTSADATLLTEGKLQRQGAMTWAMTGVLEDHNYQISNLELVREANVRLSKKGFEQRIQLACTPGMENKNFMTL